MWCPVLTSTQTCSSTATSTSTPVPAKPSAKPHKSLAFIAAALIFLVLTVIVGFLFWRRRKARKVVQAPVPVVTLAPSPTYPASRNPVLQRDPLGYFITQFRGKDVKVDRDEPALMDFERLAQKGEWGRQSYEQIDAQKRKRRYSRKGVKFFNEDHERRETERERERERGESGGVAEVEEG